MEKVVEKSVEPLYKRVPEKILKVWEKANLESGKTLEGLEEEKAKSVRFIVSYQRRSITVALITVVLAVVLPFVFNTSTYAKVYKLVSLLLLTGINVAIVFRGKFDKSEDLHRSRIDNLETLSRKFTADMNTLMDFSEDVGVLKAGNMERTAVALARDLLRAEADLNIRRATAEPEELIIYSNRVIKSREGFRQKLAGLERYQEYYGDIKHQALFDQAKAK
ncbi:MAG: hypothetical protein Q7S72_00885 [Candidatus Taylorbacteria bacterium]|nr:hypothetical protein [Candidatus Taylorbacteria bacterium]